MKNNDRLMSIGEVARSINVTRRMILNYEERGLVLPDVKEGAAGNRYYSPDTLSRIRTIRIFQDLGLSLDEIYSYFNDTTGLEPLIMRLEALRDELNLSIEKLRARLDDGEAIRIERVRLPRQTVYRREYRSETVAEKKERLRDTLVSALQTYRSDTSKRMFFIEYPLDDPAAVAYCISIPEGSEGEFVCELPETPALCITWHGGYEQLCRVRELIVEWAGKERIALGGVCRHTYLEGPPQHKDEGKFITQVALAICDGGSAAAV